jgi:hypothetical protein
VGTGGGTIYPFVTVVPGSEVRYDGGWGVLKLTLRRDRYDWEFIPVGGGPAVDHGSDRCH